MIKLKTEKYVYIIKREGLEAIDRHHEGRSNIVDVEGIGNYLDIEVDEYGELSQLLDEEMIEAQILKNVKKIERLLKRDQGECDWD